MTAVVIAPILAAERTDEMPEKKPWVVKFGAVYLENAPRKDEFGKIHDGIGTLVTHHGAGLDHRKMGMLAAEFYEYTMALRRQVVDDMGEIAVGTIGEEKLAELIEEGADK